MKVINIILVALLATVVSAETFRGRALSGSDESDGGRGTCAGGGKRRPKQKDYCEICDEEEHCIKTKRISTEPKINNCDVGAIGLDEFVCKFNLEKEKEGEDFDPENVDLGESFLYIWFNGVEDDEVDYGCDDYKTETKGNGKQLYFTCTDVD